MSDADFYSRLNKFGSLPTSTGTAVSKPEKVSQAATEKQQRISGQSAQDIAIFGSPDQQRVMATAYRQGNDIADSQNIRDIENLDIVSFAKKYGTEAALNRGSFTAQMAQLEEDKNRTRTGGQVLKDSFLDIGTAATRVGTGAAAMGAEALDWGLDTAMRAENAVLGDRGEPNFDSLAPAISQWGQGIVENLQSRQSEPYQAQREQFALEAELLKQDRENDKARDIASGTPEDVAAIKDVVRGARDAVTNYLDDPMMMGGLVPEMAGSLLPSTAAIRIIGKARALKAVTAKLGSKAKAEAYLKTAQGRSYVNSKMMDVAPIIIGITEGGAGVQQSQIEILSLTPEELKDNEQYQKLLASGMDPEKAQAELASTAGRTAMAWGLPAATATGLLNRSFNVNPLGVTTRKRVGSSIMSAARTIAKEPFEEGFQEGINQASTNLGVAAAGEDVALTRDLGIAIGSGAIGGVLGAGGMQAPGATVGTAKEIGSIAADKVRTAAKAAAARRAEELANEAGIGPEAQRAAQKAAAAEAVAIQQAAQVTTPESIEEIPGQAPELSETSAVETPTVDLRTEIATQVRDSVFYPDDQAQEYLDMWRGSGNTELANQIEQEIAQQGGLTRATIINQLGSRVDSDNPAEAAQTSVEVIAQRDAMARLSSPDMVSQIEELNEDDAIRQRFEALQEQVTTLNADPVIDAAVNRIKSLSENDLNTIFGKDLLKSDQIDAKQKSSIARALDTIARYKSDMITEELLTNVETALSQKYESNDVPTSDIKVALATIKSLKANIKALESKIASETAYQNTRGKAAKSAEQVQSDIRGRNSYDADGSTAESGYEKKTLPEHRKEIGELIAEGRLKDAESSIQALLGFARAMTNKVNALNESYKGATAENPRGPDVRYMSFNGLEEFEAKKKNWLNVHMGNSASRNFANMVYEDANMVAATANEMLVKFRWFQTE